MNFSKKILELRELSRAFGGDASARKRALMFEIQQARRIPSRSLGVLHDTLDFLRAYPDDEKLLAAVRGLTGSLRSWLEDADASALLNTGYPGSHNSYAYSYAVLLRLVQRFPGRLEIDWDEFEDEGPLLGALGLLVSAGECQALEDIGISFYEWLDACRRHATQTDLEIVLETFDGAGLELSMAAHLYESCNVPVRYALDAPGSGRCEVELPCERRVYQRAPIERERFPLEPRIRKPLRAPRPVSPARGRELLDLALAALCSRNLEIYPLIYASPADVVLVEGERGLQVLLAGVEPTLRNPLESVHFFMVQKNGVPIAYGPAAAFAGCCEMGINLFPEFRGGEIRLVYAEVMRVLRHLLGVEYYFLTAYGMGESNEDAIRSGAFWFYRKLGFAATNPEVEALARSEEEKMQADRSYRSDRRMLRRLSHTEAHFDLSGELCQPFPFGRLGMRVSARVARDHDGDRDRATRAAARRVGRALGLRAASLTPGERWALEAMAPLLDLIVDLERWSRADLAALARIVRGKGSVTERPAALGICRHPRLVDALWRAVGEQE